jgi:hypothetical protein
MLIRSAIWAVVCAFTAGFVFGCADAPSRIAETPLQHAYAALTEYHAVQDVGLALVISPDTPPALKGALIAAEDAATPLAKSVTGAVQKVEAARQQLKDGETTEAKLQIATSELAGWTLQLNAAVKDLQAAIANAKSSLKKAGAPPGTIPPYLGGQIALET